MVRSGVESSSVSLPPTSVVTAGSTIRRAIGMESILTHYSELKLVVVSPSAEPAFALRVKPTRKVSRVTVTMSAPVTTTASNRRSKSASVAMTAARRSFLVSLKGGNQVKQSVRQRTGVTLSMTLPSQQMGPPNGQPARCVFSS